MRDLIGQALIGVSFPVELGDIPGGIETKATPDLQELIVTIEDNSSFDSDPRIGFRPGPNCLSFDRCPELRWRRFRREPTDPAPQETISSKSWTTSRATLWPVAPSWIRRSVVIDGASDQNDNLTIDFVSGETFTLRDAIILNGREGDDEVVVNGGNLDATASQKIVVKGGPGQDVLRLAGRSQSLDLTELRKGTLQDVEILDIGGSGPNRLTVGADEIRALSDSTDTIRIRHDEDDSVVYDSGWSTELPRIVDGQFVHVLTHVDATIEVVNTRPFQNPIDRLDANRDGVSAPRDVLVIINRLNDLGPGELLTPSTVESGSPYTYFDVNGDLAVSPLDALQIINSLNRSLAAAEGESAESFDVVAQIDFDRVFVRNLSSTSPSTPGRSATACCLDGRERAHRHSAINGRYPVRR